MALKLKFEVWKKAVDVELERLTSMDSDMLPDWDYWTAWSNGYTPKQAAREALKAAEEF